MMMANCNVCEPTHLFLLTARDLIFGVEGPPKSRRTWKFF